MELDKNRKKAHSLVLRFLTYRARSRKEVCDYLERKGFSTATVEAVIKDMERYGYIDDLRFAEEFIASRKMRGYGLIRVRYELQQSGVDEEIIERLIAEKFDQDEDLARVEVLIGKRVPEGACLDQRSLQREAAFLKRRGFQDHLILKSLKKYDIF